MTTIAANRRGPMRPSVDELRAYYATRDGRRAARLLARTVAPVVRRNSTSRLLALGYCAPVLVGLDPTKLERLALVMPGEQGGHPWPITHPNCTCLADELQLPFADGMFDQALLLHALEFAEPPRKLLRELWRLLAPAGELILIVPNRAGLWTHFEATPFGNGHPFGRSQLAALLREALFEPVAWRTALVAPPVRGLRWLDAPLMRVAPRLGGIHFVLARKTDGLAPVMIGKVAAPVKVTPGTAALGVPIAIERTRGGSEKSSGD